MQPTRPISGHVFRVDGRRRTVWRAKYRLPDGRQVQRTIGPAWTQRGRPPRGYYTRLHAALRHWTTAELPFTNPHYSNAEIPRS